MDIDRSTVGEQHMCQVVSMFENVKAKYNTDKIYSLTCAKCLIGKPDSFAAPC